MIAAGWKVLSNYVLSASIFPIVFMTGVLITPSFVCHSATNKSSTSIEYGLIANHSTTTPIKKFAIFSERCSGSNFVVDLLSKNLIINFRFFGHKHFPAWFNLPIDYYTGNNRHYTFEQTDDFLFVIIFRNPFDWAKSLNRTPWHADKSLKNLPFSLFIRKKWILNDYALQQRNPLADINPYTLEPFSTIWELRTAKIQNMLEIQNRAANVYYVNYETAKKHPEKVLDEISKFFQIERKSIYTPVVYYKGNEQMGVFKEQQYEPISATDKAYIKSQLDLTLEKSIGYELN